MCICVWVSKGGEWDGTRGRNTQLTSIPYTTTNTNKHTQAPNTYL